MGGKCAPTQTAPPIMAIISHSPTTALQHRSPAAATAIAALVLWAAAVIRLPRGAWRRLFSVCFRCRLLIEDGFPARLGPSPSHVPSRNPTPGGYRRPGAV